MGKRIKTNVPNWVIILLGAITVMLVASTIGGLNSATNAVPIMTVKTIFWLSVSREGVGYLYRALKDKKLPDDDK
jgi:hypothetical protein